MTTENQTTRQRVVQAVDRGYELKEELEKATAAWRSAQVDQGTVRVDTKFEKAEEKAGTTKETALKAIDKIHETALGKANVPFNEAKNTYDVAMATAQLKMDEATLKAEQVYAEAVGAAQHAKDMEEATAQSAVHRAKEEVDAMQDTIQQNSRQVKEALGINLSDLVI